MGEWIVNFLNVFQGLRKTIVMLAVLVTSVVLRVKGYISGDNVEGLLKATVVAYFASNSIEHYTAMVKERLTSSNAPKPVTEIDTTTVEG